jgi:hypothetical protein
MFEKVLIISLLTFIIHAVETLSYGVRLAGVRTGKLAVALSLTGMIVLISRTSNLAQAPMMGKMVDYALLHPEFSLEAQLHIFIAAASLGTLMAILLIPTAIRISARLIDHLEEAGSLPKLFRESVSIRKLKYARRHIKLPSLEMLSRLRIGGVPKRLLILNALVTGIYTVGVLAALYASFLLPEFSVTASQSSGLINGMATILMTILVDPRVALLTDRAMNGRENLAQINKMYGLLMFSRFLGTILAQFLLVPGTYLITKAVPFW